MFREIKLYGDNNTYYFRGRDSRQGIMLRHSKDWGKNRKIQNRLMVVRQIDIESGL